jgi:hypothetical protein
MPPTISDYYRAALEELKQQVESTPDEQVLGMDPEEWLNYLVTKFGMEPIAIDDARQDQMVEVDHQRTLRGYDIYSDAGPGTVVRSTAIRVEVPVIPTDTLQEIWKHKLSPNMFSLATAYPEFDYDHHNGQISSLVYSTSAGDVKREVDNIKSSIRKYNDSINSENQAFPQQVLRIVMAKRNRVVEKHKKLDELAAAAGIPLTKKADISTVIPTAPRIRSKIAPVLPPTVKRQERPVLEQAKFEAILDLIDNQCRQFERTPQAFTQLTEEGLRDVILSSLNAIFEGAAGGETFQGIGKVDIHLRITQGEVFVSEVKFWGGAATLDELIKQLRGRLTWRDGYGVALVLSRNVGFGEVIKTVGEAIQGLEGFVKGSLRVRAENHFVARFTIASDATRHAEVHVLVYNMHAPEPARRQVKR